MREIDKMFEKGDLVKVKTKHYGTQVGMVIKHGMDGWFIQPISHPRMIIARAEDIEVMVPISRHNRRMEELGL
tara:strand:- start:1734 stop:1952 length:219 start_codon:yes stop_codon:yes gene_type:complete